MAKSGRLIVVSSPSGGGKSSVIRMLLKKYPDMVHSISSTTRPIRGDKHDKKDYTFIDKDSFKSAIERGDFAEWAVVHDNYYGTPKKPLDDALKRGIDVLLDVDVVGGINLKKTYKDQAILIFLLPPSTEILRERLRKRATDSNEQLELRLKNAMKEMEYKDDYDYRVINDDLDKTCDEIENIIRK